MWHYYTTAGKLFRMGRLAEDRFDRDSGKWVTVVPAISDWLFNLDTELEHIPEEIARGMEPTAFAEQKFPHGYSAH